MRVHHSKIGLLMTVQGHLRQFGNVSVTSAFAPIATELARRNI